MNVPPSYLQQIQLQRQQIPSFDHYPFDLPVIRSLHALEFHPKVTYIVGENGMGKSFLNNKDKMMRELFEGDKGGL